MDKAVKLWHSILASLGTGIATGLVILLFTRAGQRSDNNEAILSKKADIEYVDEQKEKVLMEFIRNMNSNISDIKADIRVIKNK